MSIRYGEILMMILEVQEVKVQFVIKRTGPIQWTPSDK